MSAFNNKQIKGFLEQAESDRARFDDPNHIIDEDYEPLPPAPVRLKPSDLSGFNIQPEPAKGGNGKVIFWSFVVAVAIIALQAFVGAYVCPPILK